MELCGKGTSVCTAHEQQQQRQQKKKKKGSQHLHTRQKSLLGATLQQAKATERVSRTKGNISEGTSHQMFQRDETLPIFSVAVQRPKYKNCTNTISIAGSTSASVFASHHPAVTLSHPVQRVKPQSLVSTEGSSGCQRLFICCLTRCGHRRYAGTYRPERWEKYSSPNPERLG